MKKKWIPVLLLSIVAAGALLFFVTVKIIESRIADAGVLGTEARLIEEKADLSLKYNNAHYDIFRGLVLTGVHISDRSEKGEKTLFSSGEAVFQFPFLDLLRGHISPSRLILFDGRIALESGHPRQRVEKLIAFLRHANLDLEWRNLQIDGLKETVDFPSKDVRLAGSLLVRRGDPLVQVRLEFRGTQIFILQGSWKSEPRERLFVRIDSMPVPLPHLWLERLTYLPAGSVVNWKEGRLNAEGSVDVTEEGYALHLTGGFEKLSFEIADMGFEARDLDGRFDQMLIGSFTSGLLHSRLNIKNPLIEHSAEMDRNPKLRIDESRFSGKLRLSQSANLKLPHYLRSAQVEYSIGLQTRHLYDRQLLTPDVQITVRDVNIAFGDQWKSIAPIRIEEATVIGRDRIAIVIPGSVGAVPFRFSATLKPDFLSSSTGEFIFRHQSEFQLDIDRFSIDDGVRRTIQFVEDLREYVAGPDSVRSEDFGPIWENKFFQNPTYRKFLEQSVVTGQIRILEVTDAAPDMPSTLQFQFRHRIPSTELILQPTGIQMSGHYRIFYDQALPAHDARFETHYTGSGLKSRLLTDPELPVDPIEALEFKYTFQAEGLYLADLYYKSLTGLFIKAKHVPVQKDYRLDLLLRLMELEPKPIRYVDFDLQRHSSGSLFKPIVLKIDAEEGSLVGTGEFNIYEGGFLQFNYFLRSNGRQNRFNIRIRPDRVWIPSS